MKKQIKFSLNYARDHGNEKVELHFHTDESSRCGKVPAKDGVRMYIEQGYAGLAVTDHFSEYACGKEGPWEDICSRFLEGWRLAKETAESAGSGFQVYLGMEIRFPHDENDFLVYGMTEEFFRNIPGFMKKSFLICIRLPKRRADHYTGPPFQTRMFSGGSGMPSRHRDF